MHRVHADDSPEETLDPVGEAGWAEFRELAHRMVDDMLDHLSGLSNQPAWRPVPAEVRAALTQAVPRTGIGADAAYREFLRLVQPYPNGNLHPRFWGWYRATARRLA
jgi:aromatic-L-amino-acid decarboxylase